MKDWGQKDNALKDFGGAVELDPLVSKYDVKLGSMLASVSESYEEALAEYLKAIELDPENSDAYIFCSAFNG